MGAVWSLILVFFLATLPLRGSKVVVALAALELGASPVVLGLLAAQYAVFPLLLSVHAGRIADRIGIKWPILGGSLVMAAAMLLPTLHINLPTLFLASALIGLGHIFIHTTVQNGVGLFSSDARRGANYGSLSVGVSVAAFIGPFAAGAVIDRLGFTAGFGLMTFLSLLILPVLLAVARRLAAPHRLQPAEAVSPRMAELLARPQIRRVLWMSAATLTGTELFAFYIPVHGHAAGLSATAIGAVLAAYSSAALVVRLATGAILRRFREPAVLAVSLTSAAVFFALAPLTGSLLPLLGIAFLLGLGLGIAGPLTIVLTYNTAPPGRSGEALGIRLTVNKFMQILVPVGFGALGTVLGIAPVFWASSAVLLVAGALSGRTEQRDRAG